LSGLEETLEYFEIEEKFASQMPKDGETCKAHNVIEMVD
jgi:hypothetical protein